MIKTTDLTKKFGDFTALNNVSCEIPDGCIYGMVGSNGAGKSTFLRLLSGIYRADKGKVQIDNDDVYENAAVKAQIMFVPDELYFLSGASIKRMHKFYKSVFPVFDDERFNLLLEAFKLPYKKPISSFSKGMKRQAATILALSARPKYIMFDETFDGLDPVMRNFVKSLICNDVAEYGATAIITSHSLRELEDTCDQLVLLHQGGVVLQSDVNNIKSSVFKVQVAFSDDYDIKRFEGINISSFDKKGSVTNMIVKGDREATAAKITALNPILFEMLPLTLEEVFTCEMENLGYDFRNVMEGLNNEG